MSRPTKLTPPVRESILDLLRVGNRRAAAARASGINEATFFRWMADSRPIYREFRDDVELAEAQAETKAVATIWYTMPREPRWSAWWLENRHSDWRRRKALPDSDPIEPVVVGPEPTTVDVSSEEIRENEQEPPPGKRGDDRRGEEHDADRQSLVMGLSRPGS